MSVGLPASNWSVIIVASPGLARGSNDPRSGD
jgi:hypothetical protein